MEPKMPKPTDAEIRVAWSNKIGAIKMYRDRMGREGGPTGLKDCKDAIEYWMALEPAPGIIQELQLQIGSLNNQLFDTQEELRRTRDHLIEARAACGDDRDRQSEAAAEIQHYRQENDRMAGIIMTLRDVIRDLMESAVSATKDRG